MRAPYRPIQVLAEVQALNERADIDGIVVQMPLPTGVDSAKVRHHMLRVSRSHGLRLSDRQLNKYMVDRKDYTWLTLWTKLVPGKHRP